MSAKSSSLKPISDNLPSNPLQMELWINKDGGVLELPDTGVSLEIPPGALEKDQLIQMRIIPYNFQGDSDLSFSSNSSVVVELLPSNLQLLKPVKLTLPHCLVLKKGCEWKAKIYSSHHDEGTQPLWRPQPDTPYVLTERNCVIKLKNFSWEKFDIGDEIVEGKRIVLYAAKDLSSSESIIHIHVGYYLELPGGEEIVSINKVSVLVKKSAVFFKKGQLPLKCLFDKIEPPAWTCGSEEENSKEISFKMAAISKGLFCTFVLNIKEGTQERHKCTCYFKAGQESELVELLFILKSQKRTGDESLTAKQPLENIDLEVRTESLRNPSLPSHQATRGEAEGNPAGAEAMTKDSKVVKDSTLWELSGKFSKEWQDVGRNLKLDETELYNIDADNRREGQKEVVYKMLLLWKRKHGMKATNKTLRDALIAANRKDLSDYLLNREQCGTTSDDCGGYVRYPARLFWLSEGSDSTNAYYMKQEIWQLVNLWNSPQKSRSLLELVLGNVRSTAHMNITLALS
ncbi:putative netrin receptor UNC5B [Apostichopus japonicus]|uniref:Putative netrin receptor UNC5B n=1 Tax=Stichopus japonicus TaxID=307972 RepID=A0A2G8K0M1_STIJA|nr:putative netrin receptor UNC5B [Apostichopus japonicus]